MININAKGCSLPQCLIVFSCPTEAREDDPCKHEERICNQAHSGFYACNSYPVPGWYQVRDTGRYRVICPRQIPGYPPSADTGLSALGRFTGLSAPGRYQVICPRQISGYQPLADIGLSALSRYRGICPQQIPGYLPLADTGLSALGRYQAICPRQIPGYLPSADTELSALGRYRVICPRQIPG